MVGRVFRLLSVSCLLVVRDFVAVLLCGGSPLAELRAVIEFGVICEQTYDKLDRMRRFFHRHNPTPHFFLGGGQGGYDIQIRTRPRFLYSATASKFHHPMFTCSEVIVVTNKQTNTPTHGQTHKQTNRRR